jgi:hypothetical protein
MPKYLKGNYRLPKNMTAKANKRQQTTEQKFEQESLAKLGGSIAFVMKSKTFVWKGDEGEKTD